MEPSTRSPEFLHPIFWESDLAAGHERYIVERGLEFGDDPAIRWLWRTLGPNTIADIVRQSRALSPNTVRLWTLMLEIPDHPSRHSPHVEH